MIKFKDHDSKMAKRNKKCLDLHIHVKNYYFDTIVMFSLFFVTMVLTLNLRTQRSGPQDHHAHVYKQKKFNKIIVIVQK